MEVAIIVAFLIILKGSSILRLWSDSVSEPFEPFGIPSFDNFTLLLQENVNVEV